MRDDGGPRAFFDHHPAAAFVVLEIGPIGPVVQTMVSARAAPAASATKTNGKPNFNMSASPTRDAGT